MIGDERSALFSFFADRFSLRVRPAGFLAAALRGDLPDMGSSSRSNVGIALRSLRTARGAWPRGRNRSVALAGDSERDRRAQRDAARPRTTARCRCVAALGWRAVGHLVATVAAAVGVFAGT